MRAKLNARTDRNKSVTGRDNSQRGWLMTTNGHANGHAAPNADWRYNLIVSRTSGAPKPVLANAITAFRFAHEWASCLAFDAFYQRVVLRGQPPWGASPEYRPWTDQDDLRAANWLQHQSILVSPDVAGRALQLAAREVRTFHPVLEYIEGCRWDGDHRNDEWAIRYLGAPDTRYVRAASAKFLISAVARVTQPGCKADCALILEGKQGLLKSTALKTLFYPWFSDDLSDLGSKDAAMQLMGVWCVEMSELDSMRRSDVSRTKAFLSRTTDHYRPPYGHHVLDQPRQNVFAGTVNDSEYLRDDTGARRFWPIKCTRIDIDGLLAVKDQLWAEARDRYYADETWWLDSPELIAEAAIEQNARRLDDPWLQEITRIVETRASCTPTELLIELSIPLRDQGQLEQNRVASCLKVLGWERRSVRHLGKPSKRYFPPQAAEISQ